MTYLRAHERKAYEQSQERIGHYGCAGRLVRLGCKPEPKKHPPQKAHIECPACGIEHTVIPSWRKRMDNEKEPELVL